MDQILKAQKRENYSLKKWINKVMSYVFFLFKCILSVWFFVCMSVRAPCASSTLDSKKMDGIRYFGTGISDSRELPDGGARNQTQLR